MSKVEHIIANSQTGSRSRRSTGFLGQRRRVMLLTLTVALLLFVFFTQPQVRDALSALLG